MGTLPPFYTNTPLSRFFTYWHQYIKKQNQYWPGTMLTREKKHKFNTGDKQKINGIIQLWQMTGICTR